MADFAESLKGWPVWVLVGILVYAVSFGPVMMITGFLPQWMIGYSRPLFILYAPHALLMRHSRWYFKYIWWWGKFSPHNGPAPANPHKTWSDAYDKRRKEAK